MVGTVAVLSELFFKNLPDLGEACENIFDMYIRKAVQEQAFQIRVGAGRDYLRLFEAHKSIMA